MYNLIIGISEMKLIEAVVATHHQTQFQVSGFYVEDLLGDVVLS